jgi:hypothetical protein
LKVGGYDRRNLGAHAVARQEIGDRDRHRLDHALVHVDLDQCPRRQRRHRGKADGDRADHED